MRFYVSNMFFGDDKVASKRHFIDANDMNNRIVSNWNKVVVDTDEVYILGGVGDFRLLKSLNGEKYLIMSDNEESYYKEFSESISSIRDEEIDLNNFIWELKDKFDTNLCIYRSKVMKDYSGDFIRATTQRGKIGIAAVFSVFGALGDYQRVVKGGVNADIWINGLYPISEVEVLKFKKHQDDLI